MIRHILQYSLTLSLLCGGALANSHHPQAFLAKIANDPHKVSKVYQAYCANCHATQPMIPLCAPRFRQASDWKVRLKPGFSQLIQHVLNGYRNMPARGGCFECDDTLLEEAAVYMLPCSAQQSWLKFKKINAPQFIKDCHEHHSQNS